MDTTRRNLLGGVLGLPWTLGPALAATADRRAAAAPAVGSRLALVDLPLIEGGTFRAGGADGLVTVVYWWASWCPFCAEMSPSVEKLWRTRRDQGLAVLGISIDKTAEPAREYRQRKGYTFPSAWYSPDTGQGMPKARTVPTLWVRDRAGLVVRAETGQLFAEDVEQIVRFL